MTHNRKLKQTREQRINSHTPAQAKRTMKNINGSDTEINPKLEYLKIL